MVSSVCPTTQDLKAFALGDLAEEELQRIADHLEACPHCNGALQTLDGYTDELVAGLQRLPAATAESPDADVPRQLLEIARRAAAAGGPGGEGSDVSLDPGRRLARRLAEGPCRLGRFELQAELGVGSFGYVFRARDTELDRTVALKVQRAGSFAGDEEIERFFREARSAAQLQHPAIVAIYDTGRTEEDVCYLVSEYIEGTTLEERLQGGRMSHAAAAELVAALADALDFAHARGVIHRDLKPSNVLLDGRDRPHVTDFGLAKRDTGDTMTTDGRVMGTPAYMSPEQARGESHEIDARTDIYSLGVMLYELLSGERPFQGNRRMLLLQVLEDEPRPPRQLDERIPRDLETICLKAMAKSPARRYPTAAALAEDLRRFLRGEPIKARPTGYGERLWRWCRRYPLAATLLVAVTLGSATGFGYLTNLSQFFVHATALDSTRMEAQMLERINAFYSEEVIDRLDKKKVHVAHDYAQRDDAVPLPATFTIDAGRRISEGNTGMQVRLYSRYPWRSDTPQKDDFERRALDVLSRRTRKEPADLEFHEFTEKDGRPVVRFAKAQIMKQSCVDCHNDTKRSPKKDWKVGDLAGVLAITRPLDRDIRRTQSGLRGTFFLMGAVTLALVAVPLAFSLKDRRQKGR